MTLKEFYNQEIKPFLKKDDKPFNHQLFNDIKDQTHKAGLITDKQVNKWIYPKNKYFSKD